MTEIFNKRFETEKRQLLRNRMPEAEAALWARIRRRQIADVKFRRQYSVDRFVLDFYCPTLTLSIEIDGPTHSDAEAREYDQYRQEFIESLDIHFFRFKNQEVYQNINEVIATIYKTIIHLKQL